MGALPACKSIHHCMCVFLVPESQEREGLPETAVTIWVVYIEAGNQPKSSGRRVCTLITEHLSQLSIQLLSRILSGLY